MFAQNVSYPAAFLAGLMSFVSPCVLPLIPAYFTFISGFSLDELTQDPNQGVRARVVFATLSFVLGFSLVFVLLGASASLMGAAAANYSQWIRIIGGVLIILLGIHLTGLLRFRHLEIERRFNVRTKPISFAGIFLVGMAFGAGWTPCVGPLLGSILIIASSQDTVWEGMRLLGVYSLGLAIPFVLISIFINYLLSFLKRLQRFIRYVNPVAGALLIVIGVLLVADRLQL